MSHLVKALTLGTLLTGVALAQEPLNPHKLSFGLLHLGYEHLQPSAIYTAVDFKVMTIWDWKNPDAKKHNHFANYEVRFGYNFGLSDTDNLITYTGVGYLNAHNNNSMRSFYDLKEWTYASFGAKIFHSFGPVFEMGLHVKGMRSLQETHRYHSQYLYNDNKEWKFEVGMPIIWHLGANKEWELQLEPYYFQIPSGYKNEYLGSKLSFAYRF